LKTTILIKTALRANLRHPGRSFLTMLGIMIGIAAIIVTFAIGRGAEEKIKAQILSMGEGAIYIIPGNVITRGDVRSSLADQIPVTTDDMRAIKGQSPGIKHISRGVFTIELLEYASSAAKDQVIGADPSIFDVNQNKLAYGAYFNQQHMQKRSHVAVIGEKIKNNLFGKEDPIGKTMRIRGNPFTVIGVLEHEDFFWGTDDPNGHVFIPFTVAKKAFRKENEHEKDLGFIALTLINSKDAPLIVRRIKRILRNRHNVEPNEEDDFIIFDQESVAKAAEDAAGIIKIFGLIAASISLLVGGIGVMNIMLVSVKERTREIGLRMAVGATRLLIRMQFLIESAVLCAIGGIFGIILGVAAEQFISHTTILPGVLEFAPLAFSFASTVLIGISFGLYPAYVASLLNPIDALLER